MDFSLKPLLSKHMKSSHVKKPKVVKFKKIKELKRYSKHHKKTVIKKEETSDTFICWSCAKIFKSKSNLSQHEKTHKILKPSEYFYCVSIFTV